MVTNASAQLFPDNTLSSFRNFLPEQLNLEGQREVAISETSYPSMHQNVTESKFMFYDKNLSKSLAFYYLEPSFYPSITDTVEVLNTLIQERHNQRESCITVELSQRRQKVEIYLANEGSGVALSSTDLGHIFGNNAGNEFGVMLKGKRPHKQKFAFDLIHIQALMIHTDLIAYIILGDTKTPLLRCFFFISKLKAGDIIRTGQYMNYQTFSNLQFRPLLKNCFHRIHIDLRDTSGEKIPFLYVGITRLVVMFGKASNIRF